MNNVPQFNIDPIETPFTYESAQFILGLSSEIYEKVCKNGSLQRSVTAQGSATGANMFHNFYDLLYFFLRSQIMKWELTVSRDQIDDLIQVGYILVNHRKYEEIRVIQVTENLSQLEAEILKKVIRGWFLIGRRAEIERKRNKNAENTSVSVLELSVEVQLDLFRRS